MGFSKSKPKATCANCGKEVGALSRFKIVDGWICVSCYELCGYKFGTLMGAKTITDIRADIENRESQKAELAVSSISPDETVPPEQSAQPAKSAPSRLVGHRKNVAAKKRLNWGQLIIILVALALVGAYQQGLREDDPVPDSPQTSVPATTSKGVPAEIDHEKERIDTENSAAAVPQSPITATKSYESWLKSMVENKVGARSSLGTARVSGIVFDGDESFPILALVADDNLTLNLVRAGMLIDATKLFKAIFDDKRADTATVVWLRPLADPYGNARMEAVMAIQMSRATAKRINWKSFLHENLPAVADEYIEVPLSQW